MQKLTPILGYIGLLLGVVVAIAAPLPGWGTPIAFICMLPGFLFSSAYVFLSTRYQIEPKSFNPGYFGMLLSSTPLIMLLYFQLSK